MTRKDYILLAEALRLTWHQVADGSPKNAVERAIHNLSDSLATDNPRFNREHFLAVMRGEKELNSRP